MKRFLKPIQAFFVLTTFVALSGCNLGQAAEPTPTEVDVNAVMTSAAATAFFQLTEIAAQATPTLAPTATLAVVDTPTEGASDTTAPTPTVQLSINITDTPAVSGLPTAIPSFTPAPIGGIATAPADLCKNSAFIEDITVADGMQFKAWDKFYKVWRMQNTGTCTWDEGFYFASWAGPPSMASSQSPRKIKEKYQFVPPGGVVDIGISMYAPGDPGEYVAHWSWYDDNGKPFGQSVTVVIVVVE
jgi:hypothetical protein